MLDTAECARSEKPAQIDISIAPGADITTVAHLTYSSLPAIVSRHPETKLAIARDDGFPCGLAVATPGPNSDVELVSVYVPPLYRRQGLGTRLLGELEECFRRGGYRVGAHFTTVRPDDQGVLHFLKKSGWDTVRLQGLICRTSVANAFETPWLVRARIPAGYKVVPWTTVSEHARPQIESGLTSARNSDNWVPHDLNPYSFEDQLHKATSLALLDEQAGDSVRGWVITHRVSNDLIRWTCSFVAPELQQRGLIVPLWHEVAKRQRAVEGAERFCFTVRMDQPRMARFVTRRMRPWLEALDYSCMVLKDPL